MTGGASGLGKATVEKFVKDGAKVVLCDLKTCALGKETVQLCDNSLYVPADITSESDIQNVLKETKAKFGRLNTVVNCAGISVCFQVYNHRKTLIHDLNEFAKVQKVGNDFNGEEFQ